MLKQCYREQAHEIKRIKFADLETAQVDVSRLAKTLDKRVEDETCVIVASCPGTKMKEHAASSPDHQSFRPARTST